MTSICSQHQHIDPDCAACNADIRDLLPDYDKKHAEALAAGLHDCECGFQYYKTVSFCPLCSRNLPGVCPGHEKYNHNCIRCRKGHPHVVQEHDD